MICSYFSVPHATIEQLETHQYMIDFFESAGSSDVVLLKKKHLYFHYSA